MDVKAYKETGILELYVAGLLSDAENQEVYNHLQQYPELLEEVTQIERAVLKLTAALSPGVKDFNSLKKQIDSDTIPKVIDLQPERNNWKSYVGWVAAILLAVGLFWTSNKSSELEEQLQVTEAENRYLETQIENARTDLVATKNLLNVIRDKDIIAVPLGGQGNYASTYAKVYWNKNDNMIYLDAEGLPDAPDGKVWQVWSLTLNPLTPTSLGTIQNFNIDNNKIFTIANANKSEAFGITLEPEGGSVAPTMEQLYTLGIVNATP